MIYRDGKHRHSAAAAKSDATLDVLLRKLRESPESIGDARRFTEAELAYLQAAMGRLAEEHLGQIMGGDPLSGKQVEKVFEKEGGA